MASDANRLSIDQSEVSKIVRKLTTMECILTGMLRNKKEASSFVMQQKLQQIEDLISELPDSHTNVIDNWNSKLTSLYGQYVDAQEAVPTNEVYSPPEMKVKLNDDVVMPMSKRNTEPQPLKGSIEHISTPKEILAMIYNSHNLDSPPRLNAVRDCDFINAVAVTSIFN